MTEETSNRIVQLSQSLPNLTLGQIDLLDAETRDYGDLAVVIHTPRSGPDHLIWFHRTADVCWTLTDDAGSFYARDTSMSRLMEQVADYVVKTQF